MPQIRADVELKTYSDGGEDILQLVDQRDQAGVVDVYPIAHVLVSPTASEASRTSWGTGVAHE
jgi:hypothetical protein